MAPSGHGERGLVSGSGAGVGDPHLQAPVLERMLFRSLMS
jgi:hypothetical protein